MTIISEAKFDIIYVNFAQRKKPLAWKKSRTKSSKHVLYLTIPMKKKLPLSTMKKSCHYKCNSDNNKKKLHHYFVITQRDSGKWEKYKNHILINTHNVYN